MFMMIPLLSHGQDRAKGTKFFNFSAGANFANLLNSEAPHKINLYGSDILPVIIPPPDIASSSAYHDYSTSLIRDVRVGVIVGAGVEYFLKNNLSFTASAAYENKGIDLNSHTSRSQEVIPGGPTMFEEETYRIKVRNNYATIPLLIRKYFGKGSLYATGGVYAAYLLESRSNIYWEKRHNIPNQTEGFSSAEILDKDVRKQFTRRFDYGVVAGGGYSFPVADDLLLNAAVLVSMGLRNVDRKYNNEYEETTIPGPNGFITMVRSTNYYGLNSDATNISASLTFGLAYRLP